MKCWYHHNKAEVTSWSNMQLPECLHWTEWESEFISINLLYEQINGVTWYCSWKQIQGDLDQYEQALFLKRIIIKGPWTWIWTTVRPFCLFRWQLRTPSNVLALPCKKLFKTQGQAICQAMTRDQFPQTFTVPSISSRVMSSSRRKSELWYSRALRSKGRNQTIKSAWYRYTWLYLK